MSEPRFQITGRLILGLGIIAIGVLFTLENLGVADAGEILRWWPLLLLALGLSRLTGFYSRQSYAIGMLLTVLGGWLLLNELGMVRQDPWDLWPVLLILLGLSMIARSVGSRMGTPANGDAASRVDAFALWSGIDRKVTARDFRGGEVTAIMGGHDIDLREAKLADGSAVIDLFVLMGGVDFRVPEDWEVSIEALPIMGGVEDRAKAPAGEPRGRLRLRGFILMGGVEVKN